ncbi:MAG: hypothetical protein AAGF24_13290 [Cyanobacteria bacterium P01_H01_bin.121]
MPSSINVICGFLGGTILSTEVGYRVLQHPQPERTFDRIADARWYLAVSWCDACLTPAGILNHQGTLSFYNPLVSAVGERTFLPSDQRQPVFDCCRLLRTGELAYYVIRQPDGGHCHRVQVQSIDIDPRYGNVVLVRAVTDSLAAEVERLAEI